MHHYRVLAKDSGNPLGQDGRAQEQAPGVMH
jgi:hypothetical protein